MNKRQRKKHVTRKVRLLLAMACGVFPCRCAHCLVGHISLRRERALARRIERNGYYSSIHPDTATARWFFFPRVVP